jgi:hypothetical protein
MKIINCFHRKLFSEIKLYIFARTFDIQLLESDNGQSSESNWRRNPATFGTIAKFRLWSEADWIWTK